MGSTSAINYFVISNNYGASILYMRSKMDESKHNKKIKKHKSDKKQKKIISKDPLSLKSNTLEGPPKKEQADNTGLKSIFSTELHSNSNIPDILVTTHQKYDAINHKAIPPYTKRKFSGDNTSYDGEPIQENLDHNEASEERRIRTKSLPQAPSSFNVNTFVSAPLLADTAKKEKEINTHELLNKRFSMATKNDVASAPICVDINFKKQTTDLPKKSLLIITFSEPISINACESDMPKIPVQVVDRTYVNNSPRKNLQRSNSVTEPPKKEFSSEEEEASYFKYLYTSMKNAFKDKLPSSNKKINEKESPLDSHSQSQPQMLSPSKQFVNTTPPNKTDSESKHNIVQNPKKQSLDTKSKPIDSTLGQKFVKLSPKTPVKTYESNIKPLQPDNMSKLVKQKLPPTQNLNKPVPKTAINPPNNSELENLKIQLRKQQEQLNQLVRKQETQQPAVASYAQHNVASPEKQQPSGGSHLNQHNVGHHNKQQPTGGSHLQSNKGTALQAILQLVEATEPRGMSHFTQNLAGAYDDTKQLIPNKYTYDQTDHE